VLPKHAIQIIRPAPSTPVSRAAYYEERTDGTQLPILMLDEERVVVEKTQGAMIRALEDWGFRPIPCSFMNFAPFGGSFHCATLDVRRRGELQSYC